MRLIENGNDNHSHLDLQAFLIIPFDSEIKPSANKNICSLINNFWVINQSA